MTGDEKSGRTKRGLDASDLAQSAGGTHSQAAAAHARGPGIAREAGPAETGPGADLLPDPTLAQTVQLRLRQDLPLRRERLRALAAADDSNANRLAMAEEAHRLAGAAAYCNQPLLQRCAAHLEAAARDDGNPPLLPLWRALDDAIAALLTGPRAP